MKKFAKMSLVAAVAVAGLSSTVSAQPLEEAIKGVDVSGMMRYRYDETSTDTKASSGTKNAHSAVNNYRLDVNTKAKVNDMVTANVTVGLSNDGAGVDLAANGSDGGATLYVRNANFAASIMGATVIAGKQSIPGPFVDNTVDDISRGTGAVALVPVGPVTLAAGYFNNHNVTKTFLAKDTDTYPQNTTISDKVKAYLPVRDAAELAVLGSVAGVSFDAWYANVSDTLDAMSFGAKASVASVNVDARYSSLDMKDAYSALGLASAFDGKSKSTVLKFAASTKVSDITLKAAFAKTGKDNGRAENRIAIDGDNDAQSDLKIWQASVGQLADATAFAVGAAMNVLPNVTATIDYAMISAKDGYDTGVKDLDVTELLIGATYAMSKNFSVHARYSIVEKDYDNASTSDVEASKGRLEVKYTF